MKKLSIIFIIYIIVYRGVDSESNVNLKTAADNLLNRLKQSVENVNKVMLEGLVVQQKLNDSENTINDKILQNAQMVQLQENFKKHQLKKGIDICRQYEAKKIETLKIELYDLLSQKVTTQLKDNNATLIAIHQQLLGIANNLQNNLNAEIKLCTDIPQKCRITIDYPQQANDCDRIITEKNTSTPSILDNTLKTTVDPILYNQITNKIYNPVTDCINKL